MKNISNPMILYCYPLQNTTVYIQTTSRATSVKQRPTEPPIHVKLPTSNTVTQITTQYAKTCDENRVYLSLPHGAMQSALGHSHLRHFRRWSQCANHFSCLPKVYLIKRVPQLTLHFFNHPSHVTKMSISN